MYSGSCEASGSCVFFSLVLGKAVSVPAVSFALFSSPTVVAKGKVLVMVTVLSICNISENSRNI